jgi:hypothetical protein
LIIPTYQFKKKATKHFETEVALHRFTNGTDKTQTATIYEALLTVKQHNFERLLHCEIQIIHKKVKTN